MPGMPPIAGSTVHERHRRGVDPHSTPRLPPTGRRAPTVLGATAVERDRRGGTPARARRAEGERAARALHPGATSAAGAPRGPTRSRPFADCARDGSLAHVFGFQHLLLATVRLSARRAVARRYAETARHNWFWGNALNPLDRGPLVPTPGGGRRQRRKSFCSGARDSDILIVSAIDAERSLVVAALPTDGPASRSATTGTTWASARPTAGRWLPRRGRQGRRDPRARPARSAAPSRRCGRASRSSIFANVFLGFAEGAFAAARALTRDRGRAWFASGVERHRGSVRAGQLRRPLRRARRRARAHRRGRRGARRAWSRGDASRPTSAAPAPSRSPPPRSLTPRAGLEVTTRIFEVTGAARHAAPRARSVLAQPRTLTLHDPVDYKLRDLGRWLLTRHLPGPVLFLEEESPCAFDRIEDAIGPHCPRGHGRRRRRRRARERGRPHYRRREGHPRGDRVHLAPHERRRLRGPAGGACAP